MTEPKLPAYQGEEPFVFVSYAHEDDVLVSAEIGWLQQQGFNVWWDEGIHGATRWRDEIAKRIQRCHLFIFYVSEHSIASQVCREELEFALGQRRPILAVHLQPTALPEGIELAIANRQALLRHALDEQDYGGKLAAAVATHLEAPLPANVTPMPQRRRRRNAAWIWIVAAPALLAAGAWLGSQRDDEGEPQIKTFVMDLGPSVSVLDPHDVAEEVRSELAMSPDGRRMVYTQAYKLTGADSESYMFLRHLDDPEPILLSHGDSLLAPFFSPDGNWVAGTGSGTGGWILVKVPVGGGSAQIIAQDQLRPLGGAWLPDDTIIFPRKRDAELFDDEKDAEGYRLYRVAAEGGMPVRITTENRDAGEIGHRRPAKLPTNEAVLFEIVRSAPALPEDMQVDVALLDLRTGDYQVLIERAHGARYSGTGHIVFIRQADLWAVPFDVSSLQINGDEALIYEGVQVTNLGYANVPYDLSDDGVSMVLLPDMPSYVPTHSFVWVSRSGAEQTVQTPDGIYASPRVSPNGHKLLLARRETPTAAPDVYIHEFERARSMTRTFVFGSTRLGGYDLFRARADGAGEPALVNGDEGIQMPNALVPGTDELVIVQFSQSTGWDIRALSTSVPGAIVDRLKTPDHEGTVSLSQDGHWIVHASSESGGNVYLRAYPDMTRRRWQVSTDGGSEPMFSLDGREIFYRQGRRMMAVDFTADPEVRLGEPRVLFEGDYYAEDSGARQYDLEYPHGDRFLMLKPTAPKQSTKLIYIHNVGTLLKRLAPTWDES
ncbi:MAG: toll/interleukin-1 receptor domain-containing protein [Gemmatimonadales bacterium]